MSQRVMSCEALKRPSVGIFLSSRPSRRPQVSVLEYEAPRVTWHSRNHNVLLGNDLVLAVFLRFT